MFALFATCAVGAALRVVTASDPFVSALSLLINLASLGVLYLMLDQSFVAISQILVYVGSVVVMFLFVIAYLGDRRELAADAVRLRKLRPFALALAAAFTALLAGVIIAAELPEPAKLAVTDAGHAFGSPSAIGAHAQVLLHLTPARSVVLAPDQLAPRVGDMKNPRR